jgi:hypothetical protein
MPFLSEELCGWIREHLETLGVDEIAVFAMEEGADGDGRRVMVATEMGLADYRYGPRASTARFAMVGRFYPWQAVRGVDLRVETSRLWALEHQTRWWLNISHPAFRAASDDPELGHALADFAKVAVVMGESTGGSAEELTPTRAAARPEAPPERAGSPRPEPPTARGQQASPPRPAPAPWSRDRMGDQAAPTALPPSGNGVPSNGVPGNGVTDDEVAGNGVTDDEVAGNGASSGSSATPVGPGATQSASRPQS